MRILGLGLATSIPKLNEQKAIETGAQLLSEVIILSIASSILFYEYKRKEDMKQSALDKEKSDIKEKIAHLEIQVKKQSSSINELERLLCHLKEELEKAKETATASSYSYIVLTMPTDSVFLAATWLKIFSFKNISGKWST